MDIRQLSERTRKRAVRTVAVGVMMSRSGLLREMLFITMPSAKYAVRTQLDTLVTVPLMSAGASSAAARTFVA